MQQGMIQLYTGTGKGKTTAAIGLAVRAAGAGKRVYIGQFVKDMAYHELRILSQIPNIRAELLGKGCFIDRKPDAADVEAAHESLMHVGQEMKKETYDLVILDEITIAIYYHLLCVEDVIHLIQQKPNTVELVLTGRYFPPELKQFCDLISEMREIKHYFNRGITSRKGIEY